MSAIGSIGNYFYRTVPAFWTNKSESEVTAVDAIGTYFVAAAPYAAALIDCGGTSQEICPSGNTGPIFPRDVPAFEPQTYRLEELLTDGLPITWKFRVTNCDGTLNGIKVRVHFDQTDPADYIEVEPDADGNVTIQKTFNRLLPGPFFAEVYAVDPNNGKSIEASKNERIKLYMPRSLPIDQIISIAGPFSADPGEEVTLTAQVTNISGFDLSVEYQWFIPNVGNPGGSVTLENGEAIIPTTFSMDDPGDYTIGIAIRIKDANGEIIAEGVKTHSFSVSGGNLCYSGPISGTVTHIPDDVMVQGSDNMHEWTVALTDCYGEAVDLADVRVDLDAYFYEHDEPVMDGNVLIVRGKLRSDLNASGAIPVTVDDGDGTGANSTVYLSFSVEEPRLLINGNEFIDQLEPEREYILGLFADVSGASYQYYLRAADGTETVISDPLHFIPTRGGRQAIVLRITTSDEDHPVIEVEKEITVTCTIAYDSATVSALDESGRPVSAAYQCISQTEYAIDGLRNQCDDPLSTISLRAQFRDGSPDLVIPSLDDGDLPVRRVLLAQSPQTTFAFTNARGERVEINWYGQPTVIQGRPGLPTAITFNVNGEYETSHQYSMMYGETAAITANPIISDAIYRWRADGLLIPGETGSILSYLLEPPFVPYNHLIALSAEVPITAPDGTLCYTQYISGSSQTINVFDPEALVAIYPEFTSDGQIPRRQVTLNAGILTSVALGDLTFDWEVTDPDGNPVTVTPVAAGNNQRVNFTPLQSGIYNLTLYIDNAPGSTRLSRQVIKRGQVTIGEFPDAEVEIEGDNYPEGDSTYTYRAVLLPSRWRAFGAEDRNATCGFRVWSLNDSGRPIITQDCLTDDRSGFRSIDVTFPVVARETDYYIEVTVTGEDASYVLSETKAIHVQPADTAAIAANFTVTTPYTSRIPTRSIEFRARPLEGAANYRWQIIARDYEPVDPIIPIDESPENETNYTFTESGVYTLRLEVENSDGDVIDAIEEDIEIYPFPPAGLEINVNNENPIFAGRTVTIIAGLSRAGGLWSEDENASYATTITHDEPDLADPTRTITVTDLDSTDSVIRWTPAASGTYNIATTVTGENGVYRVSDAESATVYVPTAAPLAFSLDSPPFAAEAGRVVSFTVLNPDPGYTYSFNYGDGSAPDEAGSHTYTSTGPKTVVVTATNRANPDIVYYLTHVITIVPLGAPVPNFTLTPGNGPASPAAPLVVTINGAGSYSNVSGVTIREWYFKIDGGEWLASDDGMYSIPITTAGNHSIEMYVVDSSGTVSEHITARVPAWAP